MFGDQILMFNFSVLLLWVIGLVFCSDYLFVFDVIVKKVGEYCYYLEVMKDICGNIVILKIFVIKVFVIKWFYKKCIIKLVRVVVWLFVGYFFVLLYNVKYIWYLVFFINCCYNLIMEVNISYFCCDVIEEK